MNDRLFLKRNVFLNKCKTINEYIALLHQIKNDYTHMEPPIPKIIAIFDNMLDREWGYEGIKLSQEKNATLNLDIV